GQAASRAVWFGAVPATIVAVVDGATLQVLAPAQAVGAVDILVDTDHGSTSLAGGFTYYPAPTLASATPPAGPPLGGQAMALVGSGFVANDPGSTAVTIGGLPATNVTVTSDTTLTCTVPSVPGYGTYDIVASNSNGAATLLGAYACVPPPTVSAIAASDGPVGGGTIITLTGTQLDVGGLAVTIGGVAATLPQASSATQATCRTPAGTVGARDVVVSTYGGSTTVLNGYTYTTFSPTGPLFANQWHLENTGQSGATAGEDASLRGAWDLGYTGRGVQVGVVDDGLEILHEDLAGNVIPNLSWDYADDNGDPTRDEHGTSVAGVTSALGSNSLGGTGAAPRSTMAGFAVITAGTTDADLADAWARSTDVLDTYNNSWGYPAIWGSEVYGFAPAPTSFSDSVAVGLTQARGGLGAVYMKAAGNSGSGVWANFDATNSLRGVLTIGAVASTGAASSYSQAGAALLVCAPSNGSGPGITTTDRSGSLGYDAGNYTNGFGGTSSATPLATGVVALVLEANPLLRWWEVPLVLARSARRNATTHFDWSQNGAGHWVNHQFGFGVVDAEAAVKMARDLEPTGSLAAWSASKSVGQLVPKGNSTGVSSTITVPADCGVAKAYAVRVTVDCDHAYASDLDITLTSPDGTQSMLAYALNRPSGYTVYSNTLAGVVLGSWRHLDEVPVGTWTLKVTDKANLLDSTWTGWTLEIEGEAAPEAPPSMKPAARPAAARPALPALGVGQEAYWDGTAWRRVALEPALVAEWSRAGEASWLASAPDAVSTVLARDGFRIWRLAPGAGLATLRTQAPLGREGSAWPVYRDGAGGRLRALTGRIVLRTQGLDSAGEQALLASQGLELVRRMAGERLLVRVRATDDPLVVARLLLDTPGVLHAEPDWWQERTPQ
ncbi:MAG: S8 family serine peptidase, partial [Planctomycetia bacterium]